LINFNLKAPKVLIRVQPFETFYGCYPKRAFLFMKGLSGFFRYLPNAIRDLLSRFRFEKA